MKRAACYTRCCLMLEVTLYGKGGKGSLNLERSYTWPGVPMPGQVLLLQVFEVPELKVTGCAVDPDDPTHLVVMLEELTHHCHEPLTREAVAKHADRMQDEGWEMAAPGPVFWPDSPMQYAYPGDEKLYKNIPSVSEAVQQQMTEILDQVLPRSEGPPPELPKPPPGHNPEHN